MFSPTRSEILNEHSAVSFIMLAWLVLWGEDLLLAETFDVAFVLGRLVASVILLFGAVFAWRLISIYKGGILQKPWLLLLAGILLFALAQLVSASSVVFESDMLRIVAAIVSLVASLAIFGGLLRLVNAWKVGS
jgi:hypothetical protein